MRRSVSAVLAAGLLAASTLAIAPFSNANVTDAPVEADTTATATATSDPVVIVAGLTAPAAFYGPLAGRLRAQGYNVSIFELPYTGLVEINTSAAVLAQHVAAVKAQTGAQQVDLVAHSMGGLASLDYVKRLGGAASVDSIVTMGTPYYGTVVVNRRNGATCQGAPGCLQLAVGSEYLVDLEQAPLPADVRITAISTNVDELVEPAINASIRSGGDNVVVQDQCADNIVSHVMMPYSGVVASGITDALQGAPVTLDCSAV